MYFETLFFILIIYSLIFLAIVFGPIAITLGIFYLYKRKRSKQLHILYLIPIYIISLIAIVIAIYGKSVWTNIQIARYDIPTSYKTISIVDVEKTLDKDQGEISFKILSTKREKPKIIFGLSCYDLISYNGNLFRKNYPAEANITLEPNIPYPITLKLIKRTDSIGCGTDSYLNLTFFRKGSNSNSEDSKILYFTGENPMFFKNRAYYSSKHESETYIHVQAFNLSNY